MAIEADEHQRPAPLCLRHLREILGEPDHRSHTTRVVARGLEPSVAMRDDIDGFVGGAWQCSPDE